MYSRSPSTSHVSSEESLDGDHQLDLFALAGEGVPLAFDEVELVLLAVLFKLADQLLGLLLVDPGVVLALRDEQRCAA